MVALAGLTTDVTVVKRVEQSTGSVPQERSNDSESPSEEDLVERKIAEKLSKAVKLTLNDCLFCKSLSDSLEAYAFRMFSIVALLTCV